MTLDKHTEQNDKIERGLYGDEINKVKGIIERVEKIEIWISNHNLKTAYLSGAVAVIVLSIKIGIDWLIVKIKS